VTRFPVTCHTSLVTFFAGGGAGDELGVAGYCELRSQDSLLLSFLESVPAVLDKLKAPVAADRMFEEMVKSAQEAAVLVLVY
jgi:hypothetical protein